MPLTVEVASISQEALSGKKSVSDQHDGLMCNATVRIISREEYLSTFISVDLCVQQAQHTLRTIDHKCRWNIMLEPFSGVQRIYKILLYFNQSCMYLHRVSPPLLPPPDYVLSPTRDALHQVVFTCSLDHTARRLITEPQSTKNSIPRFENKMDFQLRQIFLNITDRCISAAPTSPQQHPS